MKKILLNKEFVDNAVKAWDCGDISTRKLFTLVKGLVVNSDQAFMPSDEVSMIVGYSSDNQLIVSNSNGWDSKSSIDHIFGNAKHCFYYSPYKLLSNYELKK